MKTAIAFLLGWISAVSTSVAIVLLRDLVLHRRQFGLPPATRRQIRAAQAASRPRLPTLYVRDTQPADED